MKLSKCKICDYSYFLNASHSSIGQTSKRFKLIALERQRTILKITKLKYLYCCSKSCLDIAKKMRALNKTTVNHIILSKTSGLESAKARLVEAKIKLSESLILNPTNKKEHLYGAALISRLENLVRQRQRRLSEYKAKLHLND